MPPADAPKTWQRLIRFESTDGQVYYGDVGAGDDITCEAQSTLAAPLIKGNPFSENYTIDYDGGAKPVTKLLSPIASSELGSIRCLAANFGPSANPPKYPIVILKPATALNGPYEDVLVPPQAQAENMADYEVELVVVIGPTPVPKNTSKEDAHKYIQGYTVGNDLSQRWWQNTGGGGQWGVSKGFDGWAPVGPTIVARDLVPPYNELQLTTVISGDPRQSDVVSNLIFQAEDTIAFLSQGETLQPGDLFFMGSPSGCGCHGKPYLKDGDVMELTINSIGTLKNKAVFTK